MSSRNVKMYALTHRNPGAGEKRRPKPWRLRWVVEGSLFELRYATKALADHERSKLFRAMDAGDAFDEKTGRPESELRQQHQTSWYEHALAYVEMKWPDLAPNSRKSTVESLVTVTGVLVGTNAKQPAAKDVRAALAWVFNPSKHGKPMAENLLPALEWIERHSLSMREVAKPDVTRSALNACARKINGSPTAANTARRKRAVYYNALGYAVERELLDYNPIDRVQWTAPEAVEEVDRRVVANTAQFEGILAQVPKVHDRAGHYIAFFACLYYAALRPSEAAYLHRDDVTLPHKGWGRITLVETAPPAGADWTDNGDVRQARGLKHRGRGHTRRVPIPPDLVRLLREHIDEYGLGEDGLIFRGRRGGPVSYEGYARIWRKARAKSLSPRQVRSPLAGRPYDLRHAGVTLWLNGGVPAPEVAKRAGHGVAVLLKVYAGCIDGDEEHLNERIEKALQESRSRGPHMGQHRSTAKRGDESAGQG